MSKPYILLPAQREFIHVEPDVTLDVAIYQGGFGSGKTWIGSLLGLTLCQKYPGIRGLCVAQTFVMVRDTTLVQYLEHLEDFGMVHGVHYRYLKAEQKIIFDCWGSSEILFRHLDDPEKIKSLNLGFAQIEECSQVSESAFNMLLSRLRQAGIERFRLFGHTNPQASKGWIHKIFVEQNEGKTRVGDSDEFIQYRRIIAPSNQNVHLSAAYLENMENQFDSDYYRINVLGEDGDYTAGLVCKTWSRVNVDDTPYRPDLRLYLSCDFNVDPMSWVLCHRFNGEYHFFDEVILENTTTTEAADEFYRRYGNHKAGVVLTGDASGQNRGTLAEKANETNFTILRNRLATLQVTNVQLDLRNANPFVLDRTAVWNAMVCNQEGVRRVKVDPRCKWLIDNCENLRYIEGTSQIYEPTARAIQSDRNLKFTKHIWDAASYLVERYDPIKLIQPDNKRGSNKMRMHRFEPGR